MVAIIAYMDIIVDNIAIWRAILIDRLGVITQPAGLRALNPKTKLYYHTEQPLNRYVKNYTAGKGKNAVKFCLFVRTFSSDVAKVETRLDEVAKTITVAQAREINSRSVYEDFTYLNEYIKEDNNGDNAS